MVRRLPLFAALALLPAACGASPSPSAAPAATTCTGPAQTRALARLQADVTALRRAAALPVLNSLQGNAAVNRATDRFLHDVQTAPVDPLIRNRMIDHAAAALVGSCQQCFQALEATRPIPEVMHVHQGTACTTK